jgi:hypothetical protein
MKSSFASRSPGDVRRVGRAALPAVAATIAFTLGAPPQASAHTQIVTPPSKDEPVVSKPISNPWAQAHCNSAAPEVLGTDSVVGFAPYAALPCPPAPNPGGQVNPQAE